MIGQWLVAFALVGASPGERSFLPIPWRGRAEPEEQPPAPPAGTARFIPLERNLPPTAQQAHSTEDLFEQLAEPYWVRRAGPDADPLLPQCRWHHPSVTWLVHRCRTEPDSRASILPRLEGALGSRGAERLRLGAALCLAQLGDERGCATLSETFLDESAPLGARCAAIHALGLMPHVLDEEPLSELFERWFPTPAPVRPPNGTDRQPSDVRELRENDELASELLGTLLRVRLADPEYDPSHDEQLLRAAGSRSALLRRMVAVGLSGRPMAEIPESFERLLRDPEPLVRKAALAALAAHPNPAAFQAVYIACDSADPSCRAQAIGLLTRFPGPDTSNRLWELMASDSVVVREAAAQAAGELDELDLLRQAADDPSHRVRRTVAQALGRFEDPGVTGTLARLAADRSSEVQVAAIDALAGQPTELAVPALLDALGSGSVTARQAAAGALDHHWPRPGGFPAFDELTDRAQALAAIRQEWQAESLARKPTTEAVPALLEALGSNERAVRRQAAGALARHWPVAAQFPFDAPPTTRHAELDRLFRLWDQERESFVLDDPSQGREHPQAAARFERIEVLVARWFEAERDERPPLAAQLVQLGPEMVPSIESALGRWADDLDPDFVREVLAPLDRTYRLLATLWESDERAEFHVAGRLAQELAERELTRIQAAIIARQAARSRGTATWIRLLAFVERDHPSWAARLDAVGLRHADDLVCRTTCERISARGWTDSSHLLAGLFQDQRPQVRIAALEAAGRLPDPGLADALAGAMRTRSSRERLAAAASLYHLGHREGFDELVRLLHDADPAVRRIVVVTLAAQPPADHRAVMGLLVQGLADEHVEVKKAAVTGLEELTGTSFARNERTGHRIPLAEQIVKWKQALGDELERRDGSLERTRAAQAREEIDQATGLLKVLGGAGRIGEPGRRSPLITPEAN